MLTQARKVYPRSQEPSTPFLMDADVFLKLATALHELGALHVRAGDLEVSFGPQAPGDPLAGLEDLVPPQNPEAAMKQWMADQYGSAS